MRKVGQRFGFHNLRHSRDLPRKQRKGHQDRSGSVAHADAHTTLQLYAQSVNSSMVAAQGLMMKAIWRNDSNAVN